MNPMSEEEFIYTDNEEKKEDKIMNPDELKEELIVKEEKKQPRWKSLVMWTSIASAVWVILSATGLAEKWGIEQTTAKTVFDAVCTILVAFGILNNPTDGNNF